MSPAPADAAQLTVDGKSCSSHFVFPPSLQGDREPETALLSSALGELTLDSCDTEVINSHSNCGVIDTL